MSDNIYASANVVNIVEACLDLTNGLADRSGRRFLAIRGYIGI